MFKSIDQLARLFRLPNLIVLGLTQYFVRYGIFYPIFVSRGVDLQMGHIDFALLVISTLLIAAGGYVINDFYDLRIDQVNRPEKVVIGKVVSLRQAGVLHYALTILGCIIGGYVAYKVGSIKLGFVHVIIALVLFYYSLKYKRLPFVGNVTIALLAAFSIIIVWLFEFFAIKRDPLVFAEFIGYFKTLNMLVFSFAFFAFFVTLIREIIKDIEDIEGDQESGCRTLPIVYGIPKVRKILLGLSLFFFVILAATVYFQFRWSYELVGWYFAFVLGGLWLYFFIHLRKCTTAKDYHFASNLLKIIMLAGILSMQLLYVSF